MVDVIVEPSRSRLIPGFDRARERALRAGALGFAIAGSGPSVFAWVDSDEVAGRVEAEVKQVFTDQGLGADSWTGGIRGRGAVVIETG
jgi:homoserine kinase